DGRADRIKKADAEYCEAAAALSRILLGPVAEQLGKKRLLFVAEGALQYIPFSALPAPTDNQPLILSHEIVSLPSASVLAALRKETEGRVAPARSVAVIADPVFSKEDPRIRRGSETAEPVTTGSNPNANLASRVEISGSGPGISGFRRLR